MLWLLDLLKGKSYPNYSLDECQQIFEGHVPIDLEEWLLVTVGKRAGERHACFLKLVSYHVPLRGKHTVELFNEQTSIMIQVDLLSSMRQQTLQLTDRLSFERSTFVCVHKKKCLIRLKCIRNLLQIQPTHISSRNELSFRTRTQFVKNIEAILTSYTRDYQHTFPKEQIIQKLKLDIDTILTSQSKRYQKGPVTVP